jgi:hypothetical protein
LRPVILDLTVIGLAVTLEPFPAIALILLLSTPRGARKGAAFVASWMACLVVVVVATVAVTGGQPLQRGSAPSTAALVVKLGLGLVLIGLGVRQRGRIGRPRAEPTWMARLDHLSYGSAAVLGTFLQPWSLVAAGAITVLSASIATFGEYVALLYFCLLGSASLLAIELYAVFRPDASETRLGNLREWLDAHRDQAIVVVSLVVGAWLVGNSLYLLLTAA